MPAIPRFVNTASAPGGNGTSSATTGPNRAYPDGQTCETAEQAAFVADNFLDVATAGLIADTIMTVNGSTMAGVANTMVWTGDLAGGTIDTAAHRFEGSNSNVITIFDDRVKLVRIQAIKVASNANGQACITAGALSATNQIELNKCLLKQAGNAGFNEPGFSVNDADANIVMARCYVFGMGARVSSDNAGIHVLGSSTVQLYNCGVYGGYRSYWMNSGTFTVNNCWGANAGITVFAGAGTQSGSNYNSSDDATSTGGANDNTSQTFTFVNVGAQNFLLQSSDTGAKGLGTDLTAKGFDLTTDILGTTISGPTWDIGPHQVTVSGVTVEGTGVDSITLTDSGSANITFQNSGTDSIAMTDRGTAEDEAEGILDLIITGSVPKLNITGSKPSLNITGEA